MNQITHWLDGSNVYGSTETDAKLLRAFQYGLLIDSTENGSPNIDLLPKCDQSEEFEEELPRACHLCEVINVVPDGSCFNAGKFLCFSTLFRVSARGAWAPIKIEQCVPDTHSQNNQ